jgi:hypothetical protein
MTLSWKSPEIKKVSWNILRGIIEKKKKIQILLKPAMTYFLFSKNGSFGPLSVRIRIKGFFVDHE